jgi:hypothetical protein
MAKTLVLNVKHKCLSDILNRLTLTSCFIKFYSEKEVVKLMCYTQPVSESYKNNTLMRGSGKKLDLCLNYLRCVLANMAHPN